MKYTTYLLAGLASIVGCSDDKNTGSSAASNMSSLSTDLQDDLWHAHRHVHDGIQVHDHEHNPAFTGGHEHSHGHAHRHAETALGGIVVSLQRKATPGQLPGNSMSVPPRPHLEILPGLPAEINVCFLSENTLSSRRVEVENEVPSNSDSPQDTTPTAEPDSDPAPDPSNVGAGWSYWNPAVSEITITFQLEGTDYAVTAKERGIAANDGTSASISMFAASLPAVLRERLSATKARLRVSKLVLTLGSTRLRVSEQLYFQGEELSVFLH